MRKFFASVICLAAVCFLSTNLFAWYPDNIPDLDVNKADRIGIHEPTAQELSIPTVSSTTPLTGSNVASEGWTGGGFWTTVQVDPGPPEVREVHDTALFAYWSPGESDEFFEVMWIFVYTQGATINDPVVSDENSSLYDHTVELVYDDVANYSASSYWPTYGDEDDWNLWVYYIEPRSATEIIYFSQQMHQYKMEIYGVTAIPEPTTILLLLGAIAGLFIKKFKK